MIKELEREIRDLQRELAGVGKEQAGLRLKACRGDSEMREKEAKLDGLHLRTGKLRDSIRNLTRKRQLLMSEATKKDREPPKSGFISEDTCGGDLS